MSLFANDYQGGAAFEVLTPQGSNPLANWKLSGPGAKAARKVYEKGVKGYVFNCQGGHGFKMQVPKDERRGMVLLQPYLGLQVHINSGQPFSLELIVTTADNARRRLFLSSSFQEAKATAFHAKIPLQSLQRDRWMNLAFNVAELVHNCFGGQPFRSMELLILGGSFKLRRVFTLKQPPPDTIMKTQMADVTPLPAAMNFPLGVEHGTQVLESLAQCGMGLEVVHLNGKQDHSVAGCGQLELGIQGEASPPAKRAVAARRVQSGASKGAPASRIPSGGRGCSRIPGAYPRRDKNTPQQESLHEGRRVQSAALQRQGNEASGSQQLPDGGIVRDSSGVNASGHRKVASATNCSGVRGWNTPAEVRTGIKPTRVNLDLQVQGSQSSTSSIAVPGNGLPPPISAFERPPVSPLASGGAISAIRRNSLTSSVSPSNAPQPPISPKKASPVKGRNSSRSISSGMAGSANALPDVTGVSAEVGSSVERWATDSVQVSPNSKLSKNGKNGRYSESNDVSSGSTSTNRFWGDCANASRLPAEDVPLRRQVDRMSQSSVSRSALGGAASPSTSSHSSVSAYSGRVAPLTSHQAPIGMLPSQQVTVERSFKDLRAVSISRTMNQSMDGPVVAAGPIVSEEPPTFASKSSSPAPNGAIPPLGLAGPCLESASLRGSTKPSDLPSWRPSINELNGGRELELPPPPGPLRSGSKNRIELESIQGDSGFERQLGGGLHGVEQLASAVLGSLSENTADIAPSRDMPWQRIASNESAELRASVCSAKEVDDDEEMVDPQTCANSISTPSRLSGKKALSIGVSREHCAMLGSITHLEPHELREEPGNIDNSTVVLGRSMRRSEDSAGGPDLYPSIPSRDQLEEASQEKAQGRRADALILSEDGFSSNIMTQPRAFTPPVVTPSQVFDSPQKGGSALCVDDPLKGPSQHGENGAQGCRVDQSIEYRDLIYDPILNCYYDTKSNQYYSVE